MFRKTVSSVMLILLFLTGFLGAGGLHEVKSSALTKENGYLSKSKQITVTFPAPHHFIEDGQDCLTMDNCTYLTQAGEPILPVKTVLTKLPEGSNVTQIKVTTHEVTLPGKYSIIPANIPIAVGSGPVEKATQDPKVYLSSDPFPNSWWNSSVGDGIDPDSNTRVEYVSINIFPLRFVPTEQTIVQAQSATVTIDYNEAQDPNVRTTIENLIITSSLLAPYAELVAQWKNQTGISSIVLNTTWIYSNYVGSDNQERIRNCIKDFVATYGIIYVTIFGDSNQVPIRYVYIPDSGETGETYVPTDLYYADLQGTWDDNHDGIYGDLRFDIVNGIPDVYVGRIPVGTIGEASTAIIKIEGYQQSFDPTENWASRIVLASGTGSPDGFSNPDPTGHTDLNEYIANIINYPNVVKLYESSGNLSTNTMASQLNQGCLFLNFAGHGDSGSGFGAVGWLFYWAFDGIIWNGFGISDVQSLTNGLDLPVITTMSCSTARFDDQDCIAKHFVLQPNGGAIAYFGSTRTTYSRAGSWAPYGLMGELDSGIYESYNEGFTRLGQMWGESITEYVMSNSMKQVFFDQNDNLLGYLNEKTIMEFELLGDPTLSIWHAPSASVSPSSVTLDVSQSQLFTSTVSGGTPPFSYQWYMSGANQSNMIVNPGFETGNFNGWNQEGPNNASIRPDEHHSGNYSCASTYSGSQSSLYLPFRITQKLPGIMSNFVTNVSCWYKYGTSADWLIVNYTDGSVSSINLGLSSNWTQVNLNLVASKTVDSLILERTASSGFIICVDDVEFSVDVVPVSGATNATWTYVPSSLGSCEVCVQVTDNAGFIANSNVAIVTVNPFPSVTISPSSVFMDVGQSQLFTSNVTSGTMPYTYQWYLGSAPVSGATSATWTFTPTSAGSYTVYLNVTDAASAGATSNTSTVSAFNPYIIVDPALNAFTTQSMVVGSTFNINVSLVNITNFESVQFVLGWDPTLLNCTNMTEILFHAKTPSADWDNIWSINLKINNTYGFATYAQTFIDAGSALSEGYSPLNVTTTTDSPEGKLAAATLMFQVLTVPTVAQFNLTCAFHLSNVILGDVNGLPLSVGTRDGTYTIMLIHDVGVTSVLPDKTEVGKGFSANINVTVANEGDFIENFTTTAYANATIIGSENVILPSGNATIVTFTWNTTDFAYDNYTLSAYAWPVPGETNTANNNLTDGTVEVTIPGDVNGDGTVNILDSILVSNAFLSTPSSSNWKPNADTNGDGVVNILDSIILANHFLQHYP